MLEVRFTFQACEDLSSIWSSIAEDCGDWHGSMAVNRDAVDAFIFRLRHHLELLATTPDIGKPQDELLHGIRSSSIDRYTLFFRIRANTVEVLRLMIQPKG